MTTSWVWAYVPSISILRATKHKLELKGIIYHHLLQWKRTAVQFSLLFFMGKNNLWTSYMLCNYCYCILWYYWHKKRFTSKTIKKRSKKIPTIYWKLKQHLKDCIKKVEILLATSFCIILNCSCSLSLTSPQKKKQLKKYQLSILMNVKLAQVKICRERVVKNSKHPMCELLILLVYFCMFLFSHPHKVVKDSTPQ